MPRGRQQTLGNANGNGLSHENNELSAKADKKIKELNQELGGNNSSRMGIFHGDALIGDKIRPTGKLANLQNKFHDLRRIFSLDNADDIASIVTKLLTGQRVDMKSGAKIVGSMPNDSNWRAGLIAGSVKQKYDRMLHPPITYLGDQFKYRTADGKFNNALNPQLGQGGAPYAKTVPSVTHPLGALPDPGDLFDRLMAREEGGRESGSGLSSMLIYHATIIIHDIFRTNDTDKNISDSSSYLDLSPLYGFTEEMQRKVRDDKYKLGLLKPDTFAEDRLLRQPPGVCIMLVMYNRYHNYAATQLRRINENGRFSVPKKFFPPPLAAAARAFIKPEDQDKELKSALNRYEKVWKNYKSSGDDAKTPEFVNLTEMITDRLNCALGHEAGQAKLEKFYEEHTAAWDKLDDDLFNTARLITCGMYIQVSIHDYLRALMGFHNYDTNFTLDPRVDIPQHKNVSRGLGNQVTVEFNLLYRFHCAISLKDEKYAETYLQDYFGKKDDKTWNPKDMDLPEFMNLMRQARQKEAGKKQPEPWEQEFGLFDDPEKAFKRNRITGLFDDKQMVDELNSAMDDKISNFGPRNVPKCMKAIEILGIIQARKWEIGTLNDFRDFFGMQRHGTFESITPNVDVQDALRDLYEHPDKVELYPGIFCESDKDLVGDPGPSDLDSALWAAIFSDAITLVRSDRFYTVDWNTHSLTTWGMKEVTPNNDVLKSSVFHRLIQRAFPEWYPYKSIRFFHPFYTAEKNARLAIEQGYDKDFDLDYTPKKWNWLGRPTDWTYDFTGSEPGKPSKPVILDTRESILPILLDEKDRFVHPARLKRDDLPLALGQVLEPRAKVARPTKEIDQDALDASHQAVVEYFVDLMRNIIRRESVAMSQLSSQNPVYQLDIVRDFSIPVVTQYVADFLGFGHLIRNVNNPTGLYSENEVYQHITNCQVFLSYNCDETKLLQRRKAFKSSMVFLLALVEKGNIHNASRWPISRWARSGLKYLFSPILSKPNPMRDLGNKVAQEILENELDLGRASAILLLTGLDSAFNTVLAFTSVMDKLLSDLYLTKPNSSGEQTRDTCDWLEIQALAFDESKPAQEFISKIVLKTQKTSVKLPLVRKALEDFSVTKNKTKIDIKSGDVIICDIHAAESASGNLDEANEYLAYCSSYSEKFASYHPKHIAALSLVTMVRVLAQTQNLRRGHDTQGRLKKVNIDATYEGYSNYMAPMRVDEIRLKVAGNGKPQGPERHDSHLDVHEHHNGSAHKEQNKTVEVYTDKELSSVYTNKVLKPPVSTYLTQEWDEMISFPTTWKLRFNGYGPSDYSLNQFALLKEFKLNDDIQPMYQPNGPSHYGGSFNMQMSGKDSKDTSDEHKHDHCRVPDCGLSTERPATMGCKFS